jgi:antitoxin component of RelBE/YafQ-DinJ toxin-antitoxin module
MDARIQFRISEETKRLAQMCADKKGTTLSDECRRLAEKLADEQRKQEGHDAWLDEQINAAFTKLAEGRAVFTSHEEAKAKMQARKDAIKNKRIGSYV